LRIDSSSETCPVSSPSIEEICPGNTILKDSSFSKDIIRRREDVREINRPITINFEIGSTATKVPSNVSIFPSL
jgi:hypothetical protein